MRECVRTAGAPLAQNTAASPTHRQWLIRNATLRRSTSPRVTMAVATTHVPLAFAAVLVLTGLCVNACSPPMGDGNRELSLPEMVQASDTVIYGKVRRRYPDPRFDYGSGVSDVYTAEMIVFCVIRGRRTKALINVTEAGKTDQFPSLVVCGRNRGASAMLSPATARSRNPRVWGSPWACSFSRVNLRCPC